jgi:hypothetical protein
MFIGCYMSKIQKKNMRVLRFRIQRKLSQKIKSVPLKNPVSDRLTKRSIPFVNWFWKQECYDFMVYFGAHIKELEDVYDRLEDQTSKNVLVELIRGYCENDTYRLNENTPEDKYWECYRHLDDEKWVNCGSCNGDTIGWYLYKQFSYERIDAYEGDAKTFELLKSTMSLTNAENVNLYNEYIGLEGGSDTNFDARYADKGVTLINMDIEGAETGVLRGAKKLINQQKPVLAICAYHKPSDILDIPQIVLDAYSDYALYLRKYSDGYGGAGEYVYYFVPQDRKL